MKRSLLPRVFSASLAARRQAMSTHCYQARATFMLGSQPVVVRRANTTRLGCLFFALLVIAWMIAWSPSTQGSLLNLAVNSELSTFTIELKLSSNYGILLPVGSNTKHKVTLSGVAPGFSTLPPASTGFFGNVAIDGPGAGTPGTLESYGGGIDFSSIEVEIYFPYFPPAGGMMKLTAPHVDIVPGGPYLAVAPIPGSADYDFSGLQLNFNGGSFSYNFTGYLGPDSDTIALLPNAFSFNLPPGSVGKLELDTGLPTNQLATLTIPLAITVPLYSDIDPFSQIGKRVNAIFSGNLVLTSISVPEPSSIVLLGLGFIGGFPLVRRNMRRRFTWSSRHGTR